MKQIFFIDDKNIGRSQIAAAIANGRLRVVKRYPGLPGDDLEVYAKPGMAIPAR